MRVFEEADGAAQQVQGGEYDPLGLGRVGEVEEPVCERGVVAPVLGQQEEGGEAVLVGVGLFGDLFEGAEVDGLEFGGVAEVLVGWRGVVEDASSFVEPEEVFVVGGEHGSDGMCTGVLIASLSGLLVSFGLQLRKSEVLVWVRGG